MMSEPITATPKRITFVVELEGVDNILSAELNFDEQGISVGGTDMETLLTILHLSTDSANLVLQGIQAGDVREVGVEESEVT